MTTTSRAASIVTSLALVPLLTSATVHPASDEAEGEARSGGAEGAFTEFVDASQETGGNAYVLAALYRVCFDEGYETWMCADDGNDLITDGEDFHTTLEDIGWELNSAENDHTRDPEYALDEGYSGGFTDEREEGEEASDERLREEAREAWIAAIEDLPIEDAEDISEDIFETALAWKVEGAMTEDCRPDDDDGDDDDDDVEAEASSAMSIQPAASVVPASNTSPIEIPEEYVEPLEDAADVAGLPVELLAVQIEQESSWDEEARSGADARGLTQFTRETWESFGEGPFDPYPEPIAAIEAQGEYMAYLMDFVEPMADNDEEQIELALAAYNAGPGAVEEHDGVPPYSETQHYVVHIPEMANEMGADLVVAASQGGCNANYDVPDLEDVDCEAYEEGRHYDYQQGPTYPILLEDALHGSAQAGLMCGLVAFGAEYDGELPGDETHSPFGTRSGNDWGAGDTPVSIPSQLGMDHPWGGAIDITIDHQHDGTTFYFTEHGQEYGREIAEFYMEHADELNVYMVIYWEKQWFASDDPKPWDEWDAYGAGGWSPVGGAPGDSLGQEYSDYVESPDEDNLAHRNHPHISFDPR